jgi:hypothetical protein
MYVEASTSADRSMLGPMSIMLAALGVILYYNCRVKTTSPMIEAALSYLAQACHNTTEFFFVGLGLELEQIRIKPVPR